MIRRPRLLVVLPRGEAIRNIVYSGVCRLLRQEAEVMLVSIKPSEAVWQMMAEDSDALEELHEFEEPYSLGVLRELLNSAHAMRVQTEAAKHRLERRVAGTSGLGRRVKLAAKTCLGRFLSVQPGFNALARIEDYCSAVTKAAEAAEGILSRWKPDVVFNASHVHGIQARSLLGRARRLGIPLQAFVFSWDNLTTQGPIIPRYESYLVWSDSMAHQLRTIYPDTRAEDVIVTGSPQFDMHFRKCKRLSRAEFCHAVNLDPSRPIVLYTTGMANHMPYEEELVEGLLRELQDFPEAARPQVMVRVYAKDTTGRFEKVFVKHKDVCRAPVIWEEHFYTPLPEDEFWYYNELEHCDVGVNVASTVSLELLLHRKPVVNIAFDPPGRWIQPCSYSRFYLYEHYARVVESGAVRVVWQPDELRSAIEAALNDGSAPEDDAHRLLEIVFGRTLDGKSHERVALAILRFAHKAVCRQ